MCRSKIIYKGQTSKLFLAETSTHDYYYYCGYYYIIQFYYAFVKRHTHRLLLLHLSK